jgi:hypothetical protein
MFSLKKNLMCSGSTSTVKMPVNHCIIWCKLEVKLFKVFDIIAKTNNGNMIQSVIEEL